MPPTLTEVIENNDILTLKNLLDFHNYSPNQYNASGFSILNLAARFGHSDMVDFLLKRGANINLRNNNDAGMTPIMGPAAHGQFEIVKKLFYAGADIHALAKKKSTVLHKAVYWGGKRESITLQIDPNTSPYYQITRFLLEKGANPNIRDYKDWTPLIDACSFARYDLAALLLQYGAKLILHPIGIDTSKTWITMIEKAQLDYNRAIDENNPDRIMRADAIGRLFYKYDVLQTTEEIAHAAPASIIQRIYESPNKPAFQHQLKIYRQNPDQMTDPIIAVLKVQNALAKEILEDSEKLTTYIQSSTKEQNMAQQIQQVISREFNQEKRALMAQLQKTTAEINTLKAQMLDGYEDKVHQFTALQRLAHDYDARLYELERPRVERQLIAQHASLNVCYRAMLHEWKRAYRLWHAQLEGRATSKLQQAEQVIKVGDAIFSIIPGVGQLTGIAKGVLMAASWYQQRGQKQAAQTLLDDALLEDVGDLGPNIARALTLSKHYQSYIQCLTSSDAQAFGQKLMAHVLSLLTEPLDHQQTLEKQLIEKMYAYYPTCQDISLGNKLSNGGQPIPITPKSESKHPENLLDKKSPEHKPSFLSQLFSGSKISSENKASAQRSPRANPQKTPPPRPPKPTNLLKGNNNNVMNSASFFGSVGQPNDKSIPIMTDSQAAELLRQLAIN